MQLTRRTFLVGSAAGAAAVGLGMYQLRQKKVIGPFPGPKVPAKQVKYNDYSDIWREKWKWDKVAKGTHTRANCCAACSWDVYVKDGIAWREEQAAIYEPHRPDVPDFNPRGCQKGACYTHLQVADSRVLHPLKRVGERGEGKWKRLSWDAALTEIADKLVDISAKHGTETICFDDLSNTGYGPETAGDFRFSNALQVTRSHLPPPRGPTRRMGWVIRVGSYMRSEKQPPFWQPRGLKSGSLAFTWGYSAACSSRYTRPSFTYTSQEQWAWYQQFRWWVLRTTLSQVHCCLYTSFHEA